MDPGSLSLSVRALIVCLLGAARCSSTDKSCCSCSEIPQVPLTKPPPENCFKESFRYTCIDGYRREGGTSDLIRCSGSNNPAPTWNNSTLRCKRRQPGSPVPAEPLQTPACIPKRPVTTTDWTTPTSSSQSPNNRTDNAHLSGHTDHRLGTTTTAALIVCASLVIVLALMGISYVCYKRKSQQNDRPATDEEKTSMNHVPTESAL